MRSHADENAVLHVTQCSHLDEDDDDDEEVFVVVVDVVVEEEGDVVEEGDFSLAETQGIKRKLRNHLEFEESNVVFEDFCGFNLTQHQNSEVAQLQI